MKDQIRRVLANILNPELNSVQKALFNKLTNNKGLIVLLYHRVADEKKHNGSMPEMCVSPWMFEEQMAYLSRNYSCIGLSEWLDVGWEKDGIRYKKPRVLVTFDDGWKDNFQNAFPVLKKHGVPALIFLTSGYVGTKKEFWPDRLVRYVEMIFRKYKGSEGMRRSIESIKRTLMNSGKGPIGIRMPLERADCHRVLKPSIEALKWLPEEEVEVLIRELGEEAGPNGDEYKNSGAILGWDEVQLMSKEGVEFGSHTRNHVLLDRVSREEMVREIKESKSDIEKAIDKKVRGFAYPNGNYNRHVLKATRFAGYEAGFTTRYGMNWPNTDPYEIRRIRVDDRFSRAGRGGFSPSLFEFGIWRHFFRSLSA